MPAKKPFYLSSLIYLCSLIAFVIASGGYLLLKAGISKSHSYLLYADGGIYFNLYRMWHSRITRRLLSFLVRSPFRKQVLRLVDFNVTLPTDKGCILITCHTPWKRILVQWCLENDFALIVAAGNWTNQKQRIQLHGTGISELHQMLRHLWNKGRIIFVVDSFNDLNDCPVSFLNEKHNLSLTPARLAKSAGVALITVIPVLKNSRILIKPGPQFDEEDNHTDANSLMKTILAYFENEIKKNPSAWQEYVK
jgi:Bacterial lipid A biosynthesis acyltransferase